jgi:murein DD-endopeptidase MepM/ murein hydrolase activator NlpD
MSVIAHSAHRTVLIAGAVLLAVFLTTALGDRARAQGGVPIPAPAGTEWRIVAGYNTGTHADHDGNDPHAIDIARTDAPTDWTPVLSPVDGVVTWFDDNGISIVDSNGYAHLLVHLDPDPHIRRNLRVSVGDQVGRVFPVGYDANGGIAHIHYAIHATYGGGHLDRSIPFTGEYAIEGRELHWSGQYNLHSGLEFISTNTRNWTAPTTAEDPPGDPPAPDVEPNPELPATDDDAITVTQPQPEPAWTLPDDAPVGGWRTVGVQRNTSVAGLFALLQAPLEQFAVHNPRDNTYDRFDPGDSGSADVAVRSLKAGQAVWALVDAGVPWLPAPPTTPRQVTIRLSSGPNLISWQGPDRPIAEALRNVAHLSHALRYDPYRLTWQFWSPNGPAFLDTLDQINSGDALYIVVDVASVWTQLP